MKICPKCKIDKDLSEFNKDNNRVDKRQRYCRSCNKEYYKERYLIKRNEELDRTLKNNKIQRSLKRTWLNKYKLNKGCKMCGYNKNPAALHLHHKNPKDKNINPGTMTHRMWSIERMKSELNKCEVLCANCHSEYHNPLSLDDTGLCNADS